MLALWTCWVGLRWCHGSLFILGIFFFPSQSRVMHCKFTVIRGMQMCFWELQCIHAASKHRAVFNVCSICRQGLEELRSFWNIRKCRKRTSPSHLGFVSFTWWMWFHRAQRKWHDLSSWINTDFYSPIGGICDPRANVVFGKTPFAGMLTPWGLRNIDHTSSSSSSGRFLPTCSQLAVQNGIDRETVWGLDAVLQ